MNYKKIYYAIINKALRKEYSGQRWKGDGNYYELHHIIPRSLNGTNDNKNLVLLTAKEHYICHWLLVKCFDINSKERHKMLKAWFMMSATGDTKRSIISMRNYEKYKSEFGKYMAEIQKGAKNSSYGSHWYTNYITGEYKKLMPPVSNEWIRGHHFYGESMSLLASPMLTKYYTKYKRQIKISNVRRSKRIKCYNIDTLEQIYCNNDNIPEGYCRYKGDIIFNRNKTEAEQWWDDYHLGKYKSLREFANVLEITYQCILKRFRCYIPKYKEWCLKYKRKPQILEYVGVYE